MTLLAKIALAATALGLPLAAGAATGGAKENEAAERAALAHAPKPLISQARARSIALRAAPGQVAKSEYEKENGSWRWSFDIKAKGKIHEIGVDARTGKIVENSWEKPGAAD